MRLLYRIGTLELTPEQMLEMNNGLKPGEFLQVVHSFQERESDRATIFTADIVVVEMKD